MERMEDRGRGARRVALDGAIAAAIAAASLAPIGCAGNPREDLGVDVAGAYHLRIEAEQGIYEGQMLLRDAAGGTLEITEPITVPETEVTVERSEGTYRFRAPYTVVESGCTGEMRLDGEPTPADGFRGAAVIDDGCVGEIPARFTLTPRG